MLSSLTCEQKGVKFLLSTLCAMRPGPLCPCWDMLAAPKRIREAHRNLMNHSSFHRSSASLHLPRREPPCYLQVEELPGRDGKE